MCLLYPCRPAWEVCIRWASLQVCAQNFWRQLREQEVLLKLLKQSCLSHFLSRPARSSRPYPPGFSILTRTLQVVAQFWPQLAWWLLLAVFNTVFASERAHDPQCACAAGSVIALIPPQIQSTLPACDHLPAGSAQLKAGAALLLLPLLRHHQWQSA